MAAPVATSYSSEHFGAQELSESSRLLNIFLAPSKAFVSINQNPRWWGAWLLLSVVSLIFSFIFLNRVDLFELAQKQMSESGMARDVFEKLSPQAQQAQLRFSANISRVAAYLAPAIPVIQAVFVALPITLVFRLMFRVKIRLSSALAVTCYAFLPQVFSTIVSCIALAWTADPNSFDFQNPIASNPAFFMDHDRNRFFYGLAQGLDLSNLWIIILLGTGFAVVCKNTKVTRGAAIAVVAGLYAFYVLASATGAVLF